MPRRSNIAWASLLLLITAAAYWPVIECGYIWDDDLRVTKNPLLRSLDGLRLIWLDLRASKQYYPLTWTTFWVEYQLWGLNPVGFHVVNVVLHSFSAVLLWRILSLLGAPGAWLAAAIFAVHPVHVESVAWITERKNVLSGLLYLGSALAYLRFRLVDPSRRSAEVAWRFYVASLLLFLLALLSKTVASTLPAALLLVLWWRHRRIEARDVVALAPYFVLGIGAGAITMWLEVVEVGADGTDWSLGFVERCLIAGRALWFYLGKLAWPDPLIFVYPRWDVDAGVGWQYLFPAAALALAVCLWLARGRIGRGPLVAALYFAGTLSPALGFFDLYPMRYSFVADHFQYLASLGPIALASAAAAQGMERLGKTAKGFATLACVTVLSILGFLSWRHVPVYTDVGTLWRDTLSKNPDAWIARTNLAEWLRKRGEHEEALYYYREALRLEDPMLDSLHNNLGTYMAGQGRLDEAIHHYVRAVELRPDYALAHFNLAFVLEQKGELDAAIRHFQRAVEIAPSYHAAQYGLGKALTKAGRPEEAFEHFVEAARLARETQAAGGGGEQAGPGSVSRD